MIDEKFRRYRRLHHRCRYCKYYKYVVEEQANGQSVSYATCRLKAKPIFMDSLSYRGMWCKWYEGDFSDEI